MQTTTRFTLLMVLCLSSLYAAESTIQQKASKLAQAGDLNGAIGTLKEHLKTNTKDTAAYTLLARLQFYDGQADAAMATLQDGLKQTDDLSLLEMQASVYEEQGKEGPTVSHKHGSVTYSPSKDKVAEDAFKKQHTEWALAAYQKLAAKRANDPTPTLKIAELLGELERTDEALKVWEQGGKDFPQDTRFPLGQGQALVKLKRTDEAAKYFQGAILLDPHLPDAHAALADYYDQKKEPEQALQARKRAAFYEWLPSFSKLKYNDANQALFEALAPDREREYSKEEAAALNKKRADTIDRLMREKTDDSNELLGALCYNHMDCGAREDGMFAELGKRPASAPLLHRLLENHQSTCTARGAALALATQKDPNVFDWLAWALPQDTRSFFHMDLATALDVLGDPRAVKILAEFMQPSKPLTDPNNAADDDPMMERQGRAQARCRAALALGAFDTPASHIALEDGLINPDLKFYCQTALYRMKPDPKRGEEILARFKADNEQDRMALFIARRYLTRTNPDFAKTLPEVKAKPDSDVRIIKSKAR